MIPELRMRFNRSFTSERYASLLAWLEDHCGVGVEFRVSETPIFVPLALLEEMADAGAELAQALIGRADYLEAAQQAIPPAYRVAGNTAHPHFLTADFALVRDSSGDLAPRLVEIQAFPSVYGYQAVLGAGYREIFELNGGLGMFLGGLSEEKYWNLLRRTILGAHAPENVVLTEVDPTAPEDPSRFRSHVAAAGDFGRGYHRAPTGGKQTSLSKPEWQLGPDPSHLQSRDRGRTHRPQHPVAL